MLSAYPELVEFLSVESPKSRGGELGSENPNLLLNEIMPHCEKKAAVDSNELNATVC